MDLQLADRENSLLGQDFLTWLWFRSERNNSWFQTKGGDHFALNMEQRISVQGGDNDGKETASVSSPRGVLTEARTGLRHGKKVSKAQIRIEIEEESWIMTIKSDDFGLSGLKTPKVDTKQEDGDDPDSRIFEKIFLLEKCLTYLDDIYMQFVDLRVDGNWAEELIHMRKWIETEPPV
ncbi:MAG: hypothetical protein ACNI27_04745 [Desulfovibrio sp.]